MADVSVGGGATGAVYKTSLTPSEANLATSLLRSFTKSEVQYENGPGTRFVLNGSDKVLIVGDQYPHNNDKLISHTAGAVLIGNQGNDTFKLTADGTVIGGNGNDTVVLKHGGSVFLGNGNDSVNAKGNTLIHLGNGNDSVNAKGNTRIHLGNGNDTVILGHGGNVSLGNGNDSVNAKGNARIDLGSGNDTVHLHRGNDTVTAAGLATVFGAGGMVADMHGGSLSQNRGSFKSEVVSASGHVTVHGAAHEWLEGSNGAVIDAHAGGDTLQGGSGDANLVGAAGKDLFVFNLPGTGMFADTVSGFHAGDKIDLAGVNINNLLTNATTTGNYVSYSHGNATIHLTNGSTIKLVGVASLTAADFTHGI